MGFRLADVNQAYLAVTRPTPASRTPVGAAASADLAIGDAYALDANGNAYHAGADATVRGIVTGFELQAIAGVMNAQGPLSIDYASAATAASVIGCEDVTTEFECWSDNTIGAVQSNVLGLFNLGDAAPDANFAQSRQFLNVNGGAGTQFRIIKLLQSPADNAPGPACRVVVKVAQALM